MTAKQRLLADLSYSEKANILMAVALFINSNAATSDVKDFMKMLAAAMVFPENDALGFLEKDHVENQLYIDLPRRVRNVVLVVGLMAALYCGSCSEQCKNNIAIFAHHLGVNPSMPKRIFLELSTSRTWKNVDIVETLRKYSNNNKYRLISYLGLSFASIGAILSFGGSLPISICIGAGISAVVVFITRTKVLIRRKKLDNYKIPGEQG